MSIPTAIAPDRGARLVAALTWLDFVRRKDLYVVAIFMGLFVIGTVAVRIIGVANVSTARFLMGSGLSLSHGLAAILAVWFSARALPEEIERRTLLPLLAKPVSRLQVLAGKAASCLAIALGGYLLFVLATWVSVPGAPGQRLSTLAQTALLQMLALTMTAALTTALSLHFPVVVAIMVGLLWHFGAGLARGWVQAAAEGAATPIRAIVPQLLRFLPDATVLAHTELYASGQSGLPAAHFALLVAYGAGWALLLYGWAVWRFDRLRF